MRTLSNELAPHAERLTGPRIYADANVPAGVVEFMRRRLRWDVLFVMEHDDLRRARDVEHFRLAHRLHRTLVTLDRDYLDDRRFPPGETSGVLVLWAPNERLLARTLSRVDRAVFQSPTRETAPPLPLDGRKLIADGAWTDRR
jgi:predicted nuclease of predicted toxin-antitoxin system